MIDSLIVLTENFLLPNNLKPTYYDLEIRPYVGPREVWLDKAFTFEGRVAIYFTCLKPTKRVVFHSKELQLELISFESFNHANTIKMNKRFDFDLPKDLVIGTLNAECKTNGTYLLKLKFNGKISDKLYGFYISSYLDANNNNK